MIKYCFISTISLTIDCFMIKLASYMVQTGDFDVTIICNEDSEFAERIPSSIKYLPVKMERGISLSSFHSIRCLNKIFKRENFDIIQYATPNASLYSAIAGKYSGINIRVYSQWGLVYLGYNGVKKMILKAAEWITCRYSTVIQPDSPEHRKLCIEEKLYSDNKSSVIWNGSACGIDLSKFDIEKKSFWRNEIRTEFSIPQDAFVVGFSGRITRDKGINELLEVAKRITMSLPNFKFLIVGPEEGTETLKPELYQWAKQSNTVIFTGRVFDIEKYYAAMDINVLPSYREGFPTAPIEAQAMEVPVIVTNVPGPLDAIIEGETGYVIEARNSDSLETVLLSLYYNKKKCMEMGRAGRNYVVNNFEQYAFFEKVVNNRKSLYLEGRSKR